MQKRTHACTLLTCNIELATKVRKMAPNGPTLLLAGLNTSANEKKNTVCIIQEHKLLTSVCILTVCILGMHVFN